MLGGRRGDLGLGLAAAVQRRRRQPVGGDALAALRRLGPRRDPAQRVEPAAGAIGWTYAGVLGFALVYLGEHYVDRPDRRPRPRRRGSRRRAARRAARARDQPGRAAARAPSRAAEPVRARVAAGPGCEHRAEGRAERRARRRGCGDRMATTTEPSLFESPRGPDHGLRRAVLFAAIYVLLPKLAGLDDAIEKLDEADLVLVRGRGRLQRPRVRRLRGAVPRRDRRATLVHLDWRESYQITMAGLAATRLLSAGGAGGIVLSYWALRKAGMRRPDGGRADGRLPRPPLRRSTCSP